MALPTYAEDRRYIKKRAETTATAKPQTAMAVRQRRLKGATKWAKDMPTLSYLVRPYTMQNRRERRYEASTAGKRAAKREERRAAREDD